MKAGFSIEKQRTKCVLLCLFITSGIACKSTFIEEAQQTLEVARGDRIHVIEEGRESDVVALITPYELTQVINHGARFWRFSEVQINRTTLDFRLYEVPSQDTFVDEAELHEVPIAARLVLHHSSGGRNVNEHNENVRREPATLPQHAAMETASFVLERFGDDDLTRHLGQIIAANDDGDFWRSTAAPAPAASEREVLESPALLIAILLLFGLLFALAFALTEHRALLLGIFVVGALLRFAMAPRVLLGAWIHSRTTSLQSSILGSRLTREIIGFFGLAPTEAELFSFIGFVFAVVTPIAVYAHAKLLLRRERVALFAAFAIAASPHHLRFSASEVAFIPSLVFSSALFIASHLFLVSGSDDGAFESAPKRARKLIALLSLVAFFPIAIATLHARPLNILFVALIAVYAAFVSRVSKARRATLFISACLLLSYHLALNLFPTYVQEVAEAESRAFEILGAGVLTLINPVKNAILHPKVTATAIIALFLFGVFRVVLNAQGTKRGAQDTALDTRVGLFLIAWFVLFVITHALIEPQEISVQARYHLHLLIPSTFLAASAFGNLSSQWRGAALVLVAIAPLFHHPFIQNVSFTELEEAAFVRSSAMDLIEAMGFVEIGAEQRNSEVAHSTNALFANNVCHVIEYAPHSIDARFKRGGRRITRGRLVEHFGVTAIDNSFRAEPESVDRIFSQHKCVAIYLGLECYTQRETRYAPACEQLQHVAHALNAQLFRVKRLAPNQYDPQIARGIDESVTEVELKLLIIRWYPPEAH